MSLFRAYVSRARIRHNGLSNMHKLCTSSSPGFRQYTLRDSKGGLIEDGCCLKKEPVDGYESGPAIHHCSII